MKNDIATNFRLVFFSLSHSSSYPTAPAKRSLVTHLSVGLQDLEDLSGAKNKSAFLSMETPGEEALGSRVVLERKVGRMAHGAKGRGMACIFRVLRALPEMGNIMGGNLKLSRR